MNVFDWLGRWSVYSPENSAVKDYGTGRTYTYRELNNLANALSLEFMNEYKLSGGDRVAVLAENSVEYIVLFGVAQKLGITLVPLNYRLAAGELDYIIDNCDSSMIIVEDKFQEKVETLESYNRVQHKLSLDDISTILNNHEKSNIETSFNPVELDENDPVFILYTSGTTAFPKGAIYTHKMLFWNSINTELRLNITSDDRSVNIAPPFHTGAWNVLFTPFLHHGAFTVIMKNFDADAVLKLLDEEKLTLWWAVPTMLKMMSDSELFDKVKLEHLRYFVVGGESMPLDLIDKWHKKGVLIRQGYGLTEVGPNVTSLNHTDAVRKQGSIGTPNYYYQTKLVDKDGNIVRGEGVGELALKGPTVTPGYWRNEEATGETIKDDWFFTGDVVKRDNEGFLFIVDRIKNMYISGGENVYPAEVEHIIAGHPEVEEVAIVGVPDEKWGESGKAFIVRKLGSGLSENEIKEYCTGKLAKYKIPKHITFIDSLPVNDAGKIDRKKLRNAE